MAVATIAVEEEVSTLVIPISVPQVIVPDPNVPLST
jgi:hypothetical protein